MSQVRRSEPDQARHRETPGGKATLGETAVADAVAAKEAALAARDAALAAKDAELAELRARVGSG